MSDQHAPGLIGGLGHPVARTPNLDTLAQSGMSFRHAYCTNPVCVPSRADMLTGIYSHHRQGSGGWPFEVKTMAHHFSRAGYVTGLIGKMHFGDAQTHGFDYHLDFNDWLQYLGPMAKLCAEEQSLPPALGSAIRQIPSIWPDDYNPWEGTVASDGREGKVHVGRISKMPEQAHFESFVSRETVRFLRTYSGKHPFLLISSYLKPHDPFMPVERFARMFPPETMRLPATYGKVDEEKVPREIRDWIHLHPWTPELRDKTRARERIGYYYANLAQMDDCLGPVLNTLRELGIENDTIVIYTSDHGEMLGEHGLWQKFVMYDPSAGVNLLMRVPGVTASNSHCDSPVSLIQLLPTLAELCGVDVPGKMDGRSLAPLLSGSSASNGPVFVEYGGANPKYMIRDGDWKLVYYVNDMAELYNLRADPGELRNLAFDSGSEPLLARMKRRLFEWYTPPPRTP